MNDYYNEVYRFWCEEEARWDTLKSFADVEKAVRQNYPSVPNEYITHIQNERQNDCYKAVGEMLRQNYPLNWIHPYIYGTGAPTNSGSLRYVKWNKECVDVVINAYLANLTPTQTGYTYNTTTTTIPHNNFMPYSSTPSMASFNTNPFNFPTQQNVNYMTVSNNDNILNPMFSTTTPYVPSPLISSIHTDHSLTKTSKKFSKVKRTKEKINTDKRDRVDDDYDDDDSQTAPSPKPPICSGFEKYQWCFTKGHINGKSKSRLHPQSITICKYSISGLNSTQAKGCYYKSCKFCHPSHLQLNTYLNDLWSKYTNNNPNDKEGLEQKKKGALYKWPYQQNPKRCRNGVSCSDSKCVYQHKEEKKIVFIPPLVDMGKVYTSGIIKRHDVTNNKGHLKFVQDEIRSRGSTLNIVKLERLWNTDIQAKYETLYQKLINNPQNGKQAHKICAFHGTPATSIDSIINTGFDMSKIKRCAYGNGLYFAKDPQVSVGYCNGGNQMFLCELLTPVLTWVQAQNYYVVTDDSGILPVYLITFK
eukprot:TRINITY_DN5220_c0_g1_i1.p1 TRINITY_DN5220_c0_g1~~TRINITY_DN5220_c0_g1_i1.p1  ORF type:complete len:531 (-),score=63.59 TRINITY_DN5220_c0_g1_i1:30-1622(-)